MNGDCESENERQLDEEETAMPPVDPHTNSADDPGETVPLKVCTKDSGTLSPPNMINERADFISVGIRAARKSPRVVGLLVVLAIVGIMISSGNSSGTATEHSIRKENIAFDVDAPPGLEERLFRTEGKSRQRQKRRNKSDTRAKEEKTTNELPFPIIQADDEIPHGNPSLADRAADLLECRDSVINFVINATDVKDECNGLKKAFDMTCNSDSAEEIMASADIHPSVDPQRRKLFVNRKRRDWKLRLYQMVRSLRHFTASLLPADDSFFFAEDEVVGDAWEEAKYQVENGYDFVVHEDTRRRLAVDVVPRLMTTRMRFMEETEGQQNATTSVEKQKPIQSLSLPTSNKHVSDKMLSETLMLQTEEDIEAAVKVSNQTNATLNEAQSDAVASSKAVHDTIAAVSAVLNDPTSVEARTCCASILNVYHEHCDTTEGNELSDSNLFIIVFIIAFCGLVKSLIRHFKIRWLPEAAGCILVGGTYVAQMNVCPSLTLLILAIFLLSVVRGGLVILSAI
jgi:hypothetical protein